MNFYEITDSISLIQKRIINQDNWATLPSDTLYFIQGTKGLYSSIEFGITANTHDNNLKVNIDNIIAKKIN
ncbi:MAG: hypothetical protein NTW25_15895 [Candidatus Kapabacteria bacterium]|nr:hypothetical protein [Candidatus Kapabacteria bacterium]